MAVPTQPALRPVLARGFFGVAFEVGAGGVEEQQVDLEVQQVRDGEEHGLLHLRLGVGLDEQVHRPIRLVLIHAVQPRDRRVMRGPLGRGQLRTRVDAAVRDQREQHPFDVGGEPAPAQHLAQRDVDAELTPQPVEQPGRAERAGVDDGQRVADRLTHVLAAGGLTQVAVDRRDEATQAVRVEPILPAQVEQHLRLRDALDPTVVRQLHVPHDAAVSVAPRRRPQVHAHSQLALVLAGQPRHGKSCAHAISRSADPYKSVTCTNAFADGLMCPSTAEPGVTVCRYRCSGCGHVWRQNMSKTAEPRAKRYPGAGCGGRCQRSSAST